MSVSFAQQVDRVRQQLLGFTKDQEQYSFLTADCTSTAGTLSVDPATSVNLSDGLIECEDELILVSDIDRTTGTVTVLAGNNGRGRESTLPASHTANTVLVNDPLFPRQSIKQAVVDTINGVYPDLYVFKTTQIVKLAPQFEYQLPADVREVVQVNADTIGPSQINFANDHWRFNAWANTDRFPTGKSIQLLNAVTPGRKFNITYTLAPGVPVNNTDDLGTVTGFGADYDRYADLVSFGACARLLPAYESGRLQQGAIEQTERANLVPVTAATKAAQYYWGLYNQRLAEERTRLQNLYETFPHFNR